MTRNHRKERGRETEHLVARAFAADGWPHAEATGAGSPGRDIKGVFGVAPEVKARTGFEPLAAPRQAVRNAGGDVPVVIMRPNGSGPTTIDDWPAFLPFGVLRQLLRQAGYGNPPPVLHEDFLDASALYGDGLETAPEASQGRQNGGTVPQGTRGPFLDERLPRDVEVHTLPDVADWPGHTTNGDA